MAFAIALAAISASYARAAALRPDVRKAAATLPNVVNGAAQNERFDGL